MPQMNEIKVKNLLVNGTRYKPNHQPFHYYDNSVACPVSEITQQLNNKRSNTQRARYS